MHIAIIDDDSAQRAVLCDYLEAELVARGLSAQRWEFETGEAFLSQASQTRFSLVFLDIYMPGLSGIDTARAFRLADADCPLVFTTTSTDHALEGYRVRAMQYLVKPFGREEIGALLDELSRRLPPPEQFLEAKENGRPVRVRHRDILWADNYQHQVQLHLGDRRVAAVRMTFGQFTGLLSDDPRFFVCGRGILVNLSKTDDFDGRSFWVDGSQVPVSRDLTDRARDAFGEWLFRREGGGLL